MHSFSGYGSAVSCEYNLFFVNFPELIILIILNTVRNYAHAKLVVLFIIKIQLFSSILNTKKNVMLFSTETSFEN